MRGSARKALRAIVFCSAGLVALAAVKSVATRETPEAACQATADQFRAHVSSAGFTVQEADRLAYSLKRCDSSSYAKIESIAAPEPTMDTYEGRLAMLIAHRATRRAEQDQLQKTREKAAQEQRHRIAEAESSPSCARTRREYAGFRRKDSYSRDFYDRNILPVACRAEAPEDPTERMLTKKERVAAQLELLQVTEKLFVELEGVSERCAKLHGLLSLETFKADLGWRPLLTDDQMTTFYAASTQVCPSEHVILN